MFDLLGNQRTQGEESRRQGGKVFGGGSRAPIAITLLVKNPDSSERGAIHYFSVGEYKSQKEKLAIVASYRDREPEWETLTQDSHGDWLDKRDDSWYQLAPVAIEKLKRPSGIFAIWSAGLKTQRDAWAWNYSAAAVEGNMRGLVERMDAEIQDARLHGRSVVYDPGRFSWTRRMELAAQKGEELRFDSRDIVLGMYRPFCKQWLYYDAVMNEMTYQQPRLFPLAKEREKAAERTYQQPLPSSSGQGKGGVEMTYQQRFSLLKNVVITVHNPGSPRAFYVMAQDCIPDLGTYGGTQCFPLYWYERPGSASESQPLPAGSSAVRDAWGNRYIRHDAITDEALQVFRDAYPHAFAAGKGRKKRDGGVELAKEDVFWYVYGVLHSPEYRARFAANLAKELPRIPLAEDFAGFSEAGRALGELHLRYESAEPWPNLTVEGVLPGMDPGRVEKLRWGKRRDPGTGKLVADHTRLVYNAQVSVCGIPEEAQGYVVNGRSPLDWMIDRYQVRADDATGIVNDPNDYSDDPRYILDLICRLVTVSMRTQEIVAGLPPLREVAKPASWPAAWAEER